MYHCISYTHLGLAIKGEKRRGTWADTDRRAAYESNERNRHYSNLIDRWAGRENIEQQKNRLPEGRGKDNRYVRDWRREWSYTFLKKKMRRWKSEEGKKERQSERRIYHVAQNLSFICRGSIFLSSIMFLISENFTNNTSDYIFGGKKVAYYIIAVS